MHLAISRLFYEKIVEMVLVPEKSLQHREVCKIEVRVYFEENSKNQICALVAILKPIIDVSAKCWLQWFHVHKLLKDSQHKLVWCSQMHSYSYYSPQMDMWMCSERYNKHIIVIIYFRFLHFFNLCKS